MDALGTATKLEIVRCVYPDLRFGGDPDIERYFELRRNGRLSDALGVYNGPLRSRYPDDQSRVALLKYYREGDGRYAAFQESLILALGARLAARIAANIDMIVAPIERAELGDALRALKAVEGVLARFGGDSESALVVLGRYEEYSRVLSHRADLTRRALELVREYDAVARADSPADYDFIARSEAIEARRRAAAGSTRSGGDWREERYDFVRRSAELEARRREEERRKRTHYFDPARIKFGKADRARVEIPESISRREDRILAFCAKYWNQVLDPAFDHLVFLYSRKFGTRHYEVFRAIKSGRASQSSDDEILSAVSGVLSTSYNYSVSGDLYMQVMWRRLKARMEARALEARLAAPGPESKVRAAHQARKDTTSPRPPSAAELRAAEGSARKPRAATSIDRRVPRIDSSSAPRSRPQLATTPPNMPQPATSSISPRSNGIPRQQGRPADGAGITARRSPARGAALLARSPSAPEAVPSIVGKGGSISDRIRKLSGKAYDVYKTIFLERVREHIRRALLSGQTRSHGIFDTATNEAEDQVFGFMSTHYDDPFMNWENSAERVAVESLGFSVPSLDPIIAACYRRL